MLGVNLDDGRVLGLDHKDLWVFVHCAPYISRKALKAEKIASLLSSNIISNGLSDEAKVNESNKRVLFIKNACERLSDIGIFIEKNTGFVVDSTLISGKPPKMIEQVSKKNNQRWSKDCTNYISGSGKTLKDDTLSRFKLFVEAFGQHGDLKGGADSWWKLERDENMDDSLMHDIIKGAKSANTARAASRISNPGSTPIFMQGWITKRRWESEDMSASTENNPLGLPVNPLSLR